MCMMIVQDPGDPGISRRRLSEMWSDNPDGAGIVIVGSDGDVQVRRCASFSAFLQEYRKADPDLLRMLHLRYGTSGEYGLRNIHPFRIGTEGDAGWMAHNGTMPESFHSDPADCDTAGVASALRAVPASIIVSSGFRPAMDAMAGSGKLVIITDAGTLHIIGEDRGMRSGSRWYSSPPPIPGRIRRWMEQVREDEGSSGPWERIPYAPEMWDDVP